MTRLLALLAALPLLVSGALAQELTYARIKTSMGDIDLALEAERAPKTTENFLEYATSGFYDRLVFHRVVPERLIQGGGYNARLYPRATRGPIPNEAANGLKNVRGTIAMARQADPDSADSQFFVNLRDNTSLDRTGDEFAYQAGYTVFGRVVAGMAVADAIGAVATGPGPASSPFAAEVPVTPVVIERIDPIGESEVGATQAARPSEVAE